MRRSKRTSSSACLSTSRMRIIKCFANDCKRCRRSSGTRRRAKAVRGNIGRNSRLQECGIIGRRLRHGGEPHRGWSRRQMGLEFQLHLGRQELLMSLPPVPPFPWKTDGDYNLDYINMDHRQQEFGDQVHRHRDDHGLCDRVRTPRRGGDNLPRGLPQSDVQQDGWWSGFRSGGWEGGHAERDHGASEALGQASGWSKKSAAEGWVLERELHAAVSKSTSRSAGRCGHWGNFERLRALYNPTKWTGATSTRWSVWGGKVFKLNKLFMDYKESGGRAEVGALAKLSRDLKKGIAFDQSQQGLNEGPPVTGKGSFNEGVSAFPPVTGKGIHGEAELDGDENLRSFQFKLPKLPSPT